MEYTIIGKIINTHGIKGELKVFPLTDDIYRFDDLEIVYLGEEKLLVTVERVRYHKGIVILKFKEFNDINEILIYKNQFIYVDQEGRIVLPEDHFFIHDLIGCQVLDKEHNYIGELIDIISASSNDVYLIRNETKYKEYMVPAVKEFVLDVNIKEKKVIIDPIEGMIE